MQYWWLIAISISAGVAGQAAIKLGVSRPEAADTARVGATGNNDRELTADSIWSGAVRCGRVLSWIAVLSRMDLSYAYPFLALNFVLVTFVAQVGLGEVVPSLRWVGVSIICAGVVLVARSGL